MASGIVGHPRRLAALCQLRAAARGARVASYSEGESIVSELTSADFSAPRPWRLVDESMNAHPSVSIVSDGREKGRPIAYKYAPMPHEVHDFAHIVDCVNAASKSHEADRAFKEAL